MCGKLSRFGNIQKVTQTNIASSRCNYAGIFTKDNTNLKLIILIVRMQSISANASLGTVIESLPLNNEGLLYLLFNKSSANTLLLTKKIIYGSRTKILGSSFECEFIFVVFKRAVNALISTLYASNPF